MNETANQDHEIRVTIGDELGEGGFNQVLAIRKISFPSSIDKKNKSVLPSVVIVNDDDDDADHHQQEESGSSTSASNYLVYESDDGECTSISPYVLKRLRDRDDMDESQYLVGMRDLRKEASILAELKHDNIIRLYHGNCPTRTDPKNLFLVLERFEKSLDYQIALWDRHRHISNKLYQDMITDQQRSISTDISSAMNYLHERNIIFRDLKPENIGIDSTGVAKLFDFGHAKKLKSNDPDCPKVGPDEYKLTSDIGTRRYMAHEVALSKPYGLSADVYSFGAVLYEIWSLEQIWRDESYDSHAKNVYEKHKRPKIMRTWPSCVRSLLKSCWAHNPTSRPSFATIVQTLNKGKNKNRIYDEMRETLRERTRNITKSHDHLKVSRTRTPETVTDDMSAAFEDLTVTT